MLTSMGHRDGRPSTDAFAAFLTKPVRPAVLFATLSNLFDVPADTPAPRESLSADVPLPAGVRVLVAEDNPVNQKVATHTLARLGHRPVVVANGLEAVEAVLEVGYDLVLMDLQMPQMGGLEATQRIREALDGGGPYIAAVTANATVDDRDQCLAAGMDDYLSKPFRIDDLHGLLQRYAARRGIGKAEASSMASTL